MTDPTADVSSGSAIEVTTAICVATTARHPGGWFAPLPHRAEPGAGVKVCR